MRKNTLIPYFIVFMLCTTALFILLIVFKDINKNYETVLETEFESVSISEPEELVYIPTIKHKYLIYYIEAEETTEYEETEDETIETQQVTEQEPVQVEQVQEQVNKYYYIYEGSIVAKLDHSLQDYGQNLIRSLGMNEYIPYWYCQCYQESGFKMERSELPHGGYYDWGIMQTWEGLEHDPNSTIYVIIQQHPNYKTDPYDNITCGIYEFYYWYNKYNGDIRLALGSYYSGCYGQPDETYINDVLSHMNNLYEE